MVVCVFQDISPFHQSDRFTRYSCLQDSFTSLLLFGRSVADYSFISHAGNLCLHCFFSWSTGYNYINFIDLFKESAFGSPFFSIVFLIWISLISALTFKILFSPVASCLNHPYFSSLPMKKVRLLILELSFFSKVYSQCYKFF